MLKIGEFSKLSRVSVRMLRHYDEIGLLKPQSTDRFTSYRYYKEEQLVTVGRITSLKSLGFSLAEIAEILVIFDDTETLDGYLAKKQAEQAALLAGVTQTLRLLETARTRLRKEQNMSYNVTVKTLPERYAACVRMTIPSYEAEGILWKTLCDETDHMHLIPDDPCYCSVLFHDNEYKEANVDVEAQKTVKGSYPDRTRPIQDTAAGHLCQRHLQRLLRQDQRGQQRSCRMGRCQRLYALRHSVQHLSHQSA